MEQEIIRQLEMKKFIANSPSSKKILNIALMSSSLPVNVLIIGQKGVGKKLLCTKVLPNATYFDALVLEQALINQTINLDEYQELIVTNIDKVLNKKEFMEYLKNIKIVATCEFNPSEIDSSFAIKIDVPPLKERPEDLEELVNIYIKEASSIYGYEIDIEQIDMDLSQNGISLKRSIYKNLLLKSLKKEDIEQSLENYFLREFELNKDYKDLLEVFEIPLLNAAKVKYKSQVQMANHLNINRMTLRKKIDQYYGLKQGE